MSRDPSTNERLGTDERLAKLAARGRVRTGTPGAAPPSRNPLPTTGTDPGRGAGPWAPPIAPGPPTYPSAYSSTYPAAMVSASSGSGPAGRGPVAPTSRTTVRGGRHHPARRSRLVTAGVSTALMFGGIGYLWSAEVFAGPKTSTVDQGAGTASVAGDQLQPVDDPAAAANTDDGSEAPGTLPPTVPPTAGALAPTTPAATLAPAVAAPVAPAADPAPAAVDPAAADAAAAAAADAAAADAAAADTAPTDPPTTVRRAPRTAAPRPKCTGSHC